MAVNSVPTPRRHACSNAHVVDAAVGAEVERNTCGDVLTTVTRNEDVEDGLDRPEEVRGQPGDAQMLGPVRRTEVELGTGHTGVIDGHCHRARDLLEGVAAPFQIEAHRRVALVYPRGIAWVPWFRSRKTTAV
jgi:hypothetical protein